LIAAAVFTGIGFAFCGLFLSLEVLVIGFGVIFGAGMAFGYSTATPAAIKWFSPHHRGLVSGIVVSGFGLAGLYVAPLTTFLLHTFSLRLTFIALGIFYCALIILFHFFIKNPPPDYTPPPAPAAKARNKAVSVDFSAKQTIGTFQFYALWIMFFCGTFAGLKILGQLSSIGREQAELSIHSASFLVMAYALFNCIGRFACGILSDKIGRRIVLLSIFLIQAVCYVFFAQFTTLWTLLAGTALIAFCFGGMLSIFPSMTADYFGVKNLGMNFGLVFTAWGVGGVLGPLAGGLIRDHIGTLHTGYAISAVVCVIGLVFSLFIKAPVPKKEEPRREPA
jgi:OFA family oxalate/formate antiporter-like MFS transporter